MITPEQFNQIVESQRETNEILRQIVGVLEEMKQANDTFTQALDTRLELIDITLDNIEQGVGTLVTSVTQEDDA
jgi:hypothetical protein